MTDLTIRLSGAGDALALGRLAQLDSTLYDGSEVLLGESQGRPVAALPLHGGPAFADPFQPTAQVVALLELRLAQISASREAERLSPLRRAVRRLRRCRAPASA